MHVCSSEKRDISNTEVSLTSQMAQLCIGQRFWLITVFRSLITLKYRACSNKTCRTLTGRLQGSSSSVSLLWQRLLVLEQPMLYQQASQKSNLNLVIQSQRDKVLPLPSSYTLPLLSLLWSWYSSTHNWEGSETSGRAKCYMFAFITLFYLPITTACMKPDDCKLQIGKCRLHGPVSSTLHFINSLTY